MLATSPIMATSTVAERDSSASVASLLMYSSTDCSGDGEAFQASGSDAQVSAQATMHLADAVSTREETQDPLGSSLPC